MGKIPNARIYSWEELSQQCETWKQQGLKVVFTNGVFDLLHRGHLDYLTAAKREGDVLIIGVNTDASVKRFKDAGRPLVGEVDRAFALSCLRMVDAVTLFDQDTPLELINLLKPDVLVKGADYRDEEIVGAKEVRESGGRVVRIPLTAGRSTTNLIKSIAAKYSNPSK
jgi:D-beta-D-heptose 7-phosphate kinase/D-beta-D-heptose 1-phosphate adenosyltransferase